MNSELRQRLMTRLIRYEGKRNRLYHLAGIPHIGVGHNLQAKGISEAAVGQIFLDDVNDVERDLERELPWVSALSSPRQAVFFDLVFNMGLGGLLGFSQMLAAAQAGGWDAAALALLDSDYARSPLTAERARDNAAQLRSGEWTP